MSSVEPRGDEPGQWEPACGAFQAYTPRDRENIGGGHLETRNPPILVKLTKNIIQTYHSCDRVSNYPNVLSSKIYLTSPFVPASNGGHDNKNRDLILAINDVLFSEDTNHRYVIKELLGHGTFGQVAKCWTDEKNDFVAVKVIKNHPAYTQQAFVEVSILYLLNISYDPDDTHHIVRIIEHFMYKDHLCIVFEMLGPNLYELLKLNNLKGISLNLIRVFSKKILTGLSLLRDAGVIHCDLKPENILLSTRIGSTELKLIDFGSACREYQTVYSYIQSRHYRSPEVLLGHRYTTAIDMWSFGCIAVELFLGLPLFPAASQYDLLQRMMKILGGRPPDHLLESSKNTSKYFQHIGASCLYSERLHGHDSAYKFLSLEDYEKREMKMPVMGKHFFAEDWDLEKIIMSYDSKKGMNSGDIEEELCRRLMFMDFVRGLLNFDPSKRWTPWQAAQHPFLTHRAFAGPFQPPVEALQMVNARIPPHYHQHFFSNEISSHGSLGSYGSYGNSFVGSFGDHHGGLSNHHLALPPRNLALGVSPDTGRHQHHGPANHGLELALEASPDTRWHQHRGPANHRLDLAHVGLSPSSNFTPPSLGGSPMSHFQNSMGSTSIGSPSRYWPIPPVQSGNNGPSVGNAAVLGRFDKRGWDSPVSTLRSGNRACYHPQAHAHNMESSSSSYVEDTSSLDSSRRFSDQQVHNCETNAITSGRVLGLFEASIVPTSPIGYFDASVSNSQPVQCLGESIQLANLEETFRQTSIAHNIGGGMQNGSYLTYPRLIQPVHHISLVCLEQQRTFIQQQQQQWQWQQQRQPYEDSELSKHLYKHHTHVI